MHNIHTMLIMNVLPLFIGTTELLVIAGIALLLFGGKKLPEMMRGLGQGVKEFKKGMNEMNTPTDENTSSEAATHDDAAIHDKNNADTGTANTTVDGREKQQ